MGIMGFVMLPVFKYHFHLKIVREKKLGGQDSFKYDAVTS